MPDSCLYPKEEFAAAYLRRWEVELYLRDIETTMGFDILHCQTPEMITKELLIYFIAYNCMRRLMYAGASDDDGELRTINFKESLQAIRN